MMKYEDLVNKRHKKPDNGKFGGATKEIYEAVSGHSDTDDDNDEEMDPVADIPAHLADIIHNFFHVFSSNDIC